MHSSLTSPARPPETANANANANAFCQREQMLERVADAGCWSFELNPPRLTCTAALARLLEFPGFSATDAAFEHPLEFYAPDWRELMNRALQACTASGQPFDHEVQATSARGKRIWVRTLGQAIHDPSGEVIRIDGVMKDLTETRRIAQESQRVMMQLSTTLASINEAFVTLDREGRFTYVNPESERLLGRKSTELLGRRIWRELDDHDSGRLRKAVRSALATGQSAEIEDFYAPLEKWLELRIHPFVEGLAIYFRDVSERRQTQEQLLLLQTCISRLNDIVLITEAGTVEHDSLRIVFVNDAFERHTGYSQSEVLGQSPKLLQGPLTQRRQLDKIHAALLKSQPVRAELINYKKSGEQFWMELEIVPVAFMNQGVTHWVAVGRDITERKAADDEIEHLAFYDALTELPNRQLLMERLQRALSHHGPRKSGGIQTPVGVGALMFIDLDHFKVLNDTRGHSKGDLLLQKVAVRLSACVRRGDTVARLGGDEFVVMLEDLSQDAEMAHIKARVVGEKILAALSEPYDLAGHAHHGTCSIGITMFSAQQESIGDLLKQADLAMYQAKAAGRNSVCFFDPEMQAAATANAALNSELRQALHDNAFVLYYQPQVGRDGKMIGVEALIRWRQGERLVLPDQFIAQAEESGLILPLGHWVLDEACAQLAQWGLQPGTSHLSIAVNVSVRQFRHPEFVEQLMTLIKSTGIRADRLKLELTESLLATDIEVTIAKMGMLKEAGVTLSIDDFGMGYSALSYLKHMPLDQLKIDRTFVKDVLTDPNDAAIARTIIGLAQSLGLAVMAEGVETEAQRDFLGRHGCDNYQGFLFCKALPIGELEVFMKSGEGDG